MAERLRMGARTAFGASRGGSRRLRRPSLHLLQLIYMLFAFYVILGTFFETLPMMVGTLPLVHPLIVAAGIDPVWFGVFLVLMCEISLISPPVGLTLYVIQAVRNEGSIGDVFRGTVPFFLTMLVMTVLLIHWQDLALWLPRVAFD